MTRPLSTQERGEEPRLGGGSWPRNRKTLGNEKVMLRPATSLPPFLPTRKLEEVGRIMNPRVARGSVPVSREGGRKVLEENFCEDRGKIVLALRGFETLRDRDIYNS